MSVLQLVTDGLAAIQRLEPAVSSAAKVATDTVTVGTAVAQIVQKGQKMVSYFLSPKQAAAPPEAKPPRARRVKPVNVARSDVALLVDINQRMLQKVAQYLDEHKIDADLLVITNDPSYGPSVKFLNPENPEEWEDIVREFCAAWGAVKRKIGGAHVHIFLSTPLPLAFGCGAVWGTVEEATVYHYQNNTYYPVLRISRGLRQAKPSEA